jgi:hypothetical protein
MYREYFQTSAREVPNPMARTKAKKAKVVTARLAKTKNFWKVDRELDDYIDRTKLIKCGPKRLLKKLLTLRRREDSNEVQITVAGLSKLMAVNIKTIRTWFKSLEEAGFVFFQGNAWDPHRNYPKKKYAFPDTFPGFDSATVFIQKGAKAKYKRRMADPVKAKAKAKKVARLTAQNTCPANAGFIDCSPLINQRETQNSLEDTNVSSKEILETEAHSAAPDAPSVWTSKQPKRILDLIPEIKSLLTGYLRENGHKGKIDWVSNFIAKEIRSNHTFSCEQDIQGLLRDLEIVIPLFIANKPPRANKTLAMLFRFLREYIAEYVADSCVDSEWLNNFMYLGAWREFEDRKRFFREFPFCRQPDDSYDPMTGVNRY